MKIIKKPTNDETRKPVAYLDQDNWLVFNTGDGHGFKLPVTGDTLEESFVCNFDYNEAEQIFYVGDEITIRF